MATLIVEAALVANFVPSDNESALQAAVAMFFVFQVGDLRILEMARTKSLLTDFRHLGLLRLMSGWDTIFLPWRNLSDPPSRQRSLTGRCDDLPDEHCLVAVGAHGIRVRPSRDAHSGAFCVSLTQ